MGRLSTRALYPLFMEHSLHSRDAGAEFFRDLSHRHTGVPLFNRLVSVAFNRGAALRTAHLIEVALFECLPVMEPAQTPVEYWTLTL